MLRQNSVYWGSFLSEETLTFRWNPVAQLLPPCRMPITDCTELNKVNAKNHLIIHYLISTTHEEQSPTNPCNNFTASFGIDKIDCLGIFFFLESQKFLLFDVKNVKMFWEETSSFIVKMCASVIFQNVTLGNWDAIIYQGTKSFGWKNYFLPTKEERNHVKFYKQKYLF